MNKKGSIGDILIWVILAFVVLFVFGFLYFMHNTVYDSLRNVGTIGNLNITNITDTVFEPVSRDMLQGLNVIAFIILVGGAFSILVHNFLVRMHPAFFIVYVLMTIGAVIISAYLSNYYMNILSNDVIGSTLQGFTMGNFIMQWLPYWAGIIGIMGAVFLFIGTLRDREISEGIV